MNAAGRVVDEYLKELGPNHLISGRGFMAVRVVFPCARFCWNQLNQIAKENYHEKALRCLYVPSRADDRHESAAGEPPEGCRGPDRHTQRSPGAWSIC